MRLLIAADIFPPESGGPATYAVILANELMKQGVEVKIVSLNPDSDEKKVSCPVYKVKSKNKLLRYWQYYSLLKEYGKDADVIYAMGPVNAGFPALRAAKKLGKKFVVKVVGDYAWEQGQVSGKVKDSIDSFQTKNYGGKISWLKKVERKVVREADVVITPSFYLKNLVVGWGVEEDKIQVIYNAVDSEGAPLVVKPVGERWIISVGRLVPWKGMRTLIEIVPDILKLVPEAKLKIVGGGPEIKSLKALIANNKLQDSVELLGEFPHEQTLSYIHAADVLVLNSAYEGLSHVILEALSLETPVLASNVGGNPELVLSNRRGFLFKYNNKEDIKNRIVGLFKGEKFIIPAISSKEKVEFKNKFKLETMIGDTKKILCAS